MNNSGGIIIYNPSAKLFYNNGVFIQDVSFDEKKYLRIELNDSRLRMKSDEDINIPVSVIIEGYDYNGHIEYSGRADFEFSYNKTQSIMTNIFELGECSWLSVKINFDKVEMYNNTLPLDNIIV